MSTTRQRRLAAAIVSNAVADKPQSDGELLRSVGYSQSVSEKKPAEIIARTGVQKAIREILGEAGITEERLARKHAQLLDAEKKGEPDNAVQAQMVKLGWQLHGRLNEASEDDGNSIRVGVVLNLQQQLRDSLNTQPIAPECPPVDGSGEKKEPAETSHNR